MKPAEVFATVQKRCMAKAEVTQEEPWPNDIVWTVRGKMFAICSGHDTGVSLKSTLEKQAALIQHPDIEVASYVGRYGWVTVSPHDMETLDLALDLVDESYDLVVAKLKGGTKKAKA